MVKIDNNNPQMELIMHVDSVPVLISIQGSGFPNVQDLMRVGLLSSSYKSCSNVTVTDDVISCTVDQAKSALHVVVSKF